MSKQLHFTVLLEPQGEGGYTATVPALPEIVTEGESEAEALAMIEDAIVLALAHRRDQRMPIPEDRAPTLRKVSVAAA